MSEQIEKTQTVYIAESAASRCYTPILRHTLEGMGVDRPVLHLCGSDDLTSANVAAAVSTFIYAADDVVDKLQAVLQPAE